MFGRRCTFATDTHGIKTVVVNGQRRFEADVTLPVGTEIVNVTEAFTRMQAKISQPHRPGIGTVAAIVPAIDVEFMQVFIAPIKDELEDVMELGESGVAVYKESAPDERADASQDDAQLINTGQWVRCMR